MTQLTPEITSELDRIGIEKWKFRSPGCSSLAAPPIALVILYLQIGDIGNQMISEGKSRVSVIREISEYLQETFPEESGHSVSNVRKMIKFSEICNRNEKIKNLLMKFPWSYIIIIIRKPDDDEYIEKWAKECIRHRYSRKELSKKMMENDP